MDAQKVDMFLMTSGKYFESHRIPMIREKLLEMDDSKFVMLQSLNFKDTTTSLILSILIGALGIDSFYLGDTGLGIAKLLTCGGFYIWYIVDIFLIMGRTREINFEKLQTILM